MKRSEAVGYLYVLIGATLWGVSSVVAKSLFSSGVSPAELVLVRLVIATVTLLVFLLLFNRERIMISGKDLPFFLILGLIGVAGVQFTYYFTISKIQVGPAVLIQYLSPVWVSLYAFLFRAEKVTAVKVVSLLLSVTGCYLVVGGYRFDFLRLNHIGILSGLASSLFFAFYSLYGETGLKRHHPWTITLYGFGFAAVLYCLLVSPVKVVAAGYSLETWGAFLYISIFSTLVPFGFYFKGIERIRATRASITATWEPVVAGLTAYLALNELLHPLQIIGGLTVIGAVILLQRAKEERVAAGPRPIREKAADALS